jgi:hypothetical protein
MSITKVKQDVSELKKIDIEIKRLSDQLRPLRQRKKEIEEALLTYMQKQGDVTTIKLNDVELYSIEKTKREKLGKDEKEKTAITLLQQSGVSNPKKTYSDLQEMLKGKESTVPSLKLKPKKN